MFVVPPWKRWPLKITTSPALAVTSSSSSAGALGGGMVPRLWLPVITTHPSESTQTARSTSSLPIAFAVTGHHARRSNRCGKVVEAPERVDAEEMPGAYPLRSALLPRLVIIRAPVYVQILVALCP